MTTAELREMLAEAVEREEADHRVLGDPVPDCPMCDLLAALPALLDVVEAAERHTSQWEDITDPSGASDLDRALYAALKTLAAVAPPPGDSHA